MPGPVEVEYEGVSQLASAIKGLDGRIAKSAERAFQGVADDVVQHVRATVPRISGAMAASVAAQKITGGAGIGYDGSTAYASWVDYGGSWGRPYAPDGRYLQPVAMDAESDLLEAGQKAANNEVERTHWWSP